MPKKKAAPPRAVQFHIDKRADRVAAQLGDDDDHLLTTHQVAEVLAVSVGWLEGLRSSGGGPDYEKLSPKIVRYRRSKLKLWLDERSRLRTSK